jgi:hypothetical protein
MVAEEYCWAIIHAAEWSCCGGSDFSVMQFGFQMYSFVYTDTGVFLRNKEQGVLFFLNLFQ